MPPGFYFLSGFRVRLKNKSKNIYVLLYIVENVYKKTKICIKIIQEWPCLLKTIGSY